jgi:signal recognition particle subunit SRP54
MTPKERQQPKLLNYSRKKRIAKGAGLQIDDINKLVKQFEQMSKMMKMMRGGKSSKLMQMFGK